MAVGDFTTSVLSDIQLKMDAMWAEPQTSKNYSANGETVKAIMENQTAEITPLEDPEKLKTVSVHWVDFCGDTSTETSNVDQCPMDAACGEGEAKSKAYALDIFIEDCYSVNEDKLETSMFSLEEVVARGLMAKQKNILERFNAKTIAVLLANLGVNPYLGDPGTAETGTGFTDVQNKDFTIERMYPYWALVMALNKSNNAFILDGGNLYQQALTAQFNAANTNGKLANGLFGMMPFYQDLFGFARTGNSADTLLIDSGAVAVATRSKYPSTPREIGGGVNQTRYQIPLEQLPGVFLDVAYRPDCSGDQIVHKWNLKLRAGVFVNPTMCNAGNTGILGFKRIADEVAA